MPDAPTAPKHAADHYNCRRWLIGRQICWTEMRGWWDDLASGDPERARDVADTMRLLLDDEGGWTP